MNDRALLFDVQRGCSDDGPGIRTTVFFKGCPLACAWCQNPEGIRPRPEVAFHRRRCRPAECGTPCVGACPALCLQPVNGGRPALDREACRRPETGCDRCLQVCPTGALERVGRWISLDELMQRIRVDRPFFETTGGGVTLSGGEPTLQMAFASRLLHELRREGIGTALETCGDFPYERFRQVLLPHLDHIYFDLKLIDDDESRRHTGRSNRRILANFTRLVDDAGDRLRPRIPLIPGITTKEANLAGWARFLRRLGVGGCTLMPYNPLYLDKLKGLGRRPRYSRRTFMTPAEEAACVAAFAA